MRWRGRDRKVLRDLDKALTAVVQRDSRWLARNTDTSRMADVAIIPSNDTALINHYAGLVARVHALLTAT